MKTLLRVLGIIAATVILIGIVFLVYFNLSYPDVQPAAVLTVDRLPERIARGSYLANHVTVCIDCHSTRDWSKFAGPIIPGTEGKGGEEFNEQVGGVPGRIFSSNITPAGIRDYTDGELIRAFTTGVTRENRALFPLMPYHSYNHLSQEDAYSVLAYIRSLNPVDNTVGESELNFPVNFIVKTLPLSSYQPGTMPPASDSVAYGGYLATIAVCSACHTPAAEGAPVPGMDYAGGFEFLFPAGVIRSLNITPDIETGIGEWTKADFIARFKAFENEESRNVSVSMTEFNTPMPWLMYSGMTDTDLGAIYDYLRTMKPVKNQVEKFTPSKPAGG